jgi:hypothetical protein
MERVKDKVATLHIQQTADYARVVDDEGKVYKQYDDWYDSPGQERARAEARGFIDGMKYAQREYTRRLVAPA